MSQVFILNICRFLMYIILSWFTLQFFHTLLGRKYSAQMTGIVWLCCYFLTSVFIRQKLVPLALGLQLTNSQMLVFNTATSILTDGMIVLLVFWLFQGNKGKKLAMAFVYLTLCWMTTYISQTLALFVIMSQGFIMGDTAQINILFSISILANCLALYLVQRYCRNLTYILPERLSFLLFMQSGFLLFTAYVVTAVVDFLDVFRVLNESGILQGSPELYKVAGICVTAIFCAFGLWSNVMLVFGVNRIMGDVLAQEQLRLQIGHYKEMNQLNEKFLSVRHDMKNHLMALSVLLDKKDTEIAKVYVRQLTEESGLIFSGIRTGNSSVDSILETKKEECTNCSIRMESNLQIPRSNEVSDGDLSLLLGNAMEYAIEACKQLPDGSQRFIQLDSAVVRGYFVCNIKNSCCLESFAGWGETFSDVGLKNMRKGVEKHQGIMKTERSNGVFSLSFFLPMNHL